MTNIDTLLEESRAKYFHSYSVVFGRYRLSNGEKKANIIVIAYHTRMQVETKCFEGESIAEALDKLKEWLSHPHDAPTPKISIESKKEIKEQENLFETVYKRSR